MWLLSDGPQQPPTRSLDDPICSFTPDAETHSVVGSDFPVIDVCAGLASTPEFAPAL